jgi:hypothetical protein
MTKQARRTRKLQALRAMHMRNIARLVRDGATPLLVASYVLSINGPSQISVSWRIEDIAEPGSFAEAVFDILAS